MPRLAAVSFHSCCEGQPRTAYIGLGLGLPVMDGDEDEMLVELLPSPSPPAPPAPTFPATQARVPYTRTSTDESLEAYPVSPPGLTQPLPRGNEPILEAYVTDVVSFSDMGSPDVLIVAPEDDPEFMTIEVVSVAPTPADIADALDMLDLAMEQEGEVTSRIRRDVGQAGFPPTPGAPRLPHITRFSFDPLYA